MVDDTLKEMGTPKTYSKLHMSSKIIIIAWIAWKFIAHFYDVIMLMRKGASFLWGTFAIFMINYPSYINELMELLLIYLLWYHIYFAFITNYCIFNLHICIHTNIFVIILLRAQISKMLPLSFLSDILKTNLKYIFNLLLYQITKKKTKKKCEFSEFIAMTCFIL